MKITIDYDKHPDFSDAIQIITIDNKRATDIQEIVGKRIISVGWDSDRIIVLELATEKAG